ncbi:hypothetical protein MACJ_003836 [Theileria orientalis]|uniref:Uncharacterized protein n=1 Tax=Theileria orientalis TaxID=68886 RepID=A0A976SKP8_THEOR|nr:hypothetical protein MACJ_003836 [Theileria orientalis]
MAVDDVRTLGEQKEGANKPEGSDEAKDKSFTDSVLETFSTFGNSVRGFCVETGNSLKGCAYPVKERVVKAYDDVVSTFKTKGTRNDHKYKNVSRFGNESSYTPKSTKS